MRTENKLYTRHKTIKENGYLAQQSITEFSCHRTKQIQINHFRMLGLTNLWTISDEMLESTVSALFKGQTQSLHISSRGCQTIHWAWKSRSFLIRMAQGGFSRHKILETSLKQPKQSHQQKSHFVLMNSQYNFRK